MRRFAILAAVLLFSTPALAGSPCAHSDTTLQVGGVDLTAMRCSLMVAGRKIASMAQVEVSLEAQIEMLSVDLEGQKALAKYWAAYAKGLGEKPAE